MYSTFVTYKNTSCFVMYTMAVSRDDILQLLKMRGPLVPNAIKKVIGGDSIILGATLAELSSRKLVKLTNLKKGGSPFYYLPGQESMLETCVEYLNPKDADTVAFLREKKVVADRELELFQRVSMRQIKDFAKEFKAQTSQGELLFWHYYLVSEQEAINILNQRNKPVPSPVPPPTPQLNSQSSIQESVTNSSNETTVSQPPSSSPLASAQESLANVSSAEPSSSVLATATQSNLQSASSSPAESVSYSSPEPQKSQRINNDPSPQETTQSLPQEDSVKKDELLKDDNKKESPQESKPKKVSKPSSPKNTPIKETPSSSQEDTLLLDETPFLQRCRSYFKEKNILILDEELIKKNAEYEFLVLTPSPVGDLSMFVRAKDKKRLNEGDVAPALLRAKTKDLTCLFLTTGEFTKKSLALIKEEYQGLLIGYFD
jgi:DNA polymerase III gamma/tau subunit